MNRNSHRVVIDQAFSDLVDLQERTREPAPVPHRYVGTILDNTVALMVGPANALDAGSRQIAFDDDGSWLSTMKAVHRSYLSSLQIAVEAALRHIADERNINIVSRQGDGLISAFNTVAQYAPDALVKDVERVRRHLHGLRPLFTDHLEAVFGASSLSKRKKSEWRMFFSALSVARNKASHSDPTLSEHERQTLRDGGLQTTLSPEGTFVFNPAQYANIANKVLDFFDELLKSI